ncbi:GAF domain-containing sensor histidine kinase [Mucilaginibacter lacusdianchii]|uniref:GAF domain-containing sensor histidine kinase n=1 Tax=Mucilaginibacter lacusdianchii TaxID=2684211 RepID=UPI00131E88DF|nr:ATP-binding protein [Mucilaginibacter sp. JXJ CY 39]
MQPITPPVPANEMERIIELSEFDLDYGTLQDQFKDLTTLAAKIAGTHISLVNLIDSYTSWTIANHGLPLEQYPREDTVCQYTIAEGEKFEVEDLSVDDRFKNKAYVSGDPNLRYYFGIPLKTSSGYNIGSLCVFDTESKPLTPEKVEMLKIIAGEIVNRLQVHKIIQNLKSSATNALESKKRVAHDIRGPIGGIIGLARIISEQGDENTMEEVLEFINLIHKSGNSILELADEILSADVPLAASAPKLGANEFNQVMLKDKLEKLYTPQAFNKGIEFVVTTNADTEVIPFSKNKLLQIIGNLISNSMKFTPMGGKVSVEMGLKIGTDVNQLHFNVQDTGVGMTEDKVNAILHGQGTSTNGTSGEQGYGFGLALVKHLVDSLKGEMKINSSPGEGTSFEISIPQVKNA